MRRSRRHRPARTASRPTETAQQATSYRHLEVVGGFALEPRVAWRRDAVAGIDPIAVTPEFFPVDRHRRAAIVETLERGPYHAAARALSFRLGRRELDALAPAMAGGNGFRFHRRAPMMLTAPNSSRT